MLKTTSKVFTNVSIILPVMNETHSLSQTIQIIEQDCASDVCQYILVVDKKTSADSLKRCQRYAQQPRFRLHCQSRPFLGSAIQEGFALATGSHVITMGSDLETDPHCVKTMIAVAKQHPEAVITASRWLKHNAFEHYGRLKQGLNYAFQQYLKLLFQSKLSDMTFGFRLLPTALVQSIHWQHRKHPFILETLLKPLRLGGTHH
jgi:glycosyltransferase involved in cell wall biosynthesis